MTASLNPEDSPEIVLSRGREYSLSLLADMHATLEALPELHGQVETVVAAGSIGRLEASEWSDADVIVVLRDATHADAELARTLHQSVYAALSDIGLRLPKNWGIFTTPTSVAELCDPARLGRLDESPTVFGKRMQLILDSHAAWSAPGLKRVQAAILDWYATGFLAAEPRREWTHLLNDLIRYWRSYCAWQQFELKVEEDDAWLVRNAKLQHSRLMNYAGLLLLLGEASRQGSAKREWLAPRLRLTPLERVTAVYEAHADPGIEIIRLHYARFMLAMEDGGVRQRLVADSPRHLHQLPPVHGVDYAPLHAGARAIRAELLRFVLARQQDWSPRFMEYLLF
jgi:predicted nucleotidyltransferase